MIDIEIPAFLSRAGQPARLPRPIRWKRIQPRPRPEGQVWEDAERWEVFLTDTTAPIACGLRRVWVVEGRKWARLCDGEAKVKVPIALWRQLQRHAKAL